jgi:hypothetical protein
MSDKGIDINDVGDMNEPTKERKPRRWVWPVATTAALVIGIAIGGAGDTEPASPDTASISEEQDQLSEDLDAKSEALNERAVQLDEQQAEIDAWVAPAPETVEVSSDACLEALDLAEEAFGYASEFAGYTGELSGLAAEAVTAAALGDDVWMSELTDQVLDVNDGISGLTSELERVAPQYIEARDECRS